jgi:hypothetical protein
MMEVSMCPVCLATAAVIAGSATGAGGVTAFVAQTVLRRKTVCRSSIKSKEMDDGNYVGRS